MGIEGETEWRTRTRGWGRIREKFGRGRVKYWQRETAIFTGDAPDTKAGLLYMVMVLGLREIMCLLSCVGGRYATFNGRPELWTVSTRTQYKHSAHIAVCNTDFVINHSQIYLLQYLLLCVKLNSSLMILKHNYIFFRSTRFVKLHQVV